MPDFSQVSAAAGAAAEVPDFARLEARAARRRRRRHAAYVGGVGLLVVGAVGAGSLLGGGRPAQPSPEPTVSITPTPSTDATSRPDPRSAAEIVEDPRSRMATLAVSPQDPAVRATVWQWCISDERCDQRFAVALSDDGFRHRTVLPTIYRRMPDLRATGGSFVLRTGVGPGSLVRPDGTTTSLRVVEGPTVPADGLVLDVGAARRVWVAVDERSGIAVPVPESADMFQVTRLGDGSLAALERDPEAVGLGTVSLRHSTDGGYSWNRVTLDLGANPLPSIVPSDGTVLAVDQGGDGATLSPLTALHRVAAGETEDRVSDPAGPTAFTSGMVVLPDGRLLVAVEEWGADGLDPGLFVAPADDWAELTRVDLGAPFSGRTDLGEGFLTVVVTRDRASVYLPGPPGSDHAAYRSDDGGVSWSPVDGR